MHRALPLLAIAAALLAAEAPAAGQTTSPYRALVGEIAGPWPELQTEEGLFPDRLHEGDPPAFVTPSAMLGYGLLASGTQLDDPDQVRAGLRALNYAVTHSTRDPDPGVFDHLAIASAYNLARERHSSEPLFARRRGAWERWLSRIRLFWLPNERHYANKYLVEAVAVLESLRSRVRSDERGAALRDRSRALALAARLVNSRVPSLAARGATIVGGERAFVLSDPSNNSPAYHALSLGMYARAIELLGSRASPSARRTLHEVAQASWGLMAPDGDVAYHGRSQELAWTLTLTAAGAASAARVAGADEAAGRYRALAERALDRLWDVYENGRYGFNVAPSFNAGDPFADRGVDPYAGTGYAGLTLATLTWAVDGLEAGGATPGELGADRPGGAYRLARGGTEWIAVRTPAAWFAVRRAAHGPATDLRWDFGLVALKAPDGEGGWRDVLRVRPRTTGRPDGAGPLLGQGSTAGLPQGERTTVGPGGVVTVTGGWRRPRGGGWLRRGVAFRFEPVDCGVRMVVPARAGDRVEYSVFFRASQPPERPDAATLTDGSQRVTSTPPPAGVKFDGPYASAIDARLTRVRLVFKPAAGGPLEITICSER
jgi:hypothetical protein